jgi:predicted ATPase/DNA-binding CsgD family transcriptional regulator
MAPVTSVGSEALSAREAEVLDALRGHRTNAEIAQDLHISVRTVESHVSSLLRKLGAADRRELAALATEVAPPPPVEVRELSGLPTAWTTFIGRAAELEEIAGALRTDRLVTLVGPGGIGKTRLAVVAAERAATTFAAGGAFVNLVPVSADFVVEAVAAALGVVERAQESLEDIVHERLREGRVLLVLDNCEHVLTATATFAQAVLGSCPDAVVLATSRERLGVNGERVLPVPPLGIGRDGESADAQLLFADRAASAAGADADPTLVAEVCRRLDGMPLAIELAAARSASLGVDGLLTGLDDHLRLLSRSNATDDRHGSLRTVIDWSHELLDGDERTLFRRLGIFAGGFDLPSAAEVAGDGDLTAASDVIGRLADKNLLVHGRSADGSRWRMLETVRAYAHEKLAASGEEEEVRRRHLLWAATTAARLEAELDDEATWQHSFDLVADDLRAALKSTAVGSVPDHADHRLALALGHLTYARRFLGEARDHYADAVVRAPDEAAAVAALRTAADAAFAEMLGESAFDLLTTAYERAAAAGDRAVAAIALADAAAAAGRCPATFREPLRHERIVELIAEARRVAPPDDALVAVHLAVADAWDGRVAPTVPTPEAADEALRRARELGDPLLVSTALDAVCAASAYEGRYKDAWRVTRERLALLDRLPRHDPRFGGEISDIFHMASETAIAAGELEPALAHSRRAQADRIGQGLAHFAATHLVVPLMLRGDFDEALIEAAVMRDGWERNGRPTAGWMSPAFFATAFAHGVRGDDGALAEWWELAMLICAKTRANGFNRFVEPRLALHVGDIDKAVATAREDKGGGYDAFGAYGRAVLVEAAVAAGKPDAERLLEATWPVGEENDFVAAALTRAAGVLHDDEAEIEKAVAQWEAIGARFERACTLVLLPHRADEGRAELEALGCTRPVRP